MARILIIEDEASVRGFLQDLLEIEGHTVFVAPDGRNAVELCRRNGCELIVTDVCMPHCDGLETIAALRRDFPAVALIAISGGGRREDVLQAARQRGASHTFRKPFALEDFLGAVRAELT